jgi:putative flippase GtrA
MTAEGAISGTSLGTVNVTPLSVLDRVTGGRGVKAIRYSMVSVVGVGVHQVVLLTAYAIMGMRGVTANVIAASVAAVPAFLLNKRWVWGAGGGAHFRREVLPFWAFTIAGLLLSTAFVAVADAWTESALFVAGASIAGFGVLWVAKFLFLDQVMFGKLGDPEPVAIDA